MNRLLCTYLSWGGRNHWLEATRGQHVSLAASCSTSQLEVLPNAICIRSSKIQQDWVLQCLITSGFFIKMIWHVRIAGKETREVTQRKQLIAGGAKHAFTRGTLDIPTLTL